MTELNEPQSLTRVTVNFTPKSVDALQRSAQREATSRTSVINKAVQLYDFIAGRIIDAEDEILLRSGDGSELTRVHIL